MIEFLTALANDWIHLFGYSPLEIVATLKKTKWLPMLMLMDCTWLESCQTLQKENRLVFIFALNICSTHC